MSHVDAHDGAVRSLQFVDAAPPRPRIAARRAARARTRGAAAAPGDAAARGHAAAPGDAQGDAAAVARRLAAPRGCAAAAARRVEPEAPPPPPSPARLYREKQQKSPDKAPAAVSPAPAPPAFYEALDDVADELRASIQNLHVDVLRQFQIQKSEVAALLEAHEARIADARARERGARRENGELRLPCGGARAENWAATPCARSTPLRLPRARRVRRLKHRRSPSRSAVRHANTRRAVRSIRERRHASSGGRASPDRTYDNERRRNSRSPR